MIIFKYLNKQLLVSALSITLILMLVLVSSRFIKYIGEVADGGIALKFLFSLLLFRLPDMVLMVLPVSLLLAILLVFGRMYLDNEIPVFASTGISIKKLTLYSMGTVALISLLAGYLSLFVVPWGLRQVDQLFVANANRTAFDTLLPGRFVPLGPQGRLLYAETLSDDHKVMKGVFIAQEKSNKNEESQIAAQEGYLEINQQPYSKFLILHNGYRYDGSPGNFDFRRTQFDSLGIKLPTPASEEIANSTRGLPSKDLLQANGLKEIAELQWRISLPLLVPIIALLGIPLSRINPRQGRYTFLLPAILFYVAYIALLSSMKTAVENGSISPWLGLWWVHLLFLSLALTVFSNLHRKFFALLHPKLLKGK